MLVSLCPDWRIHTMTLFIVYIFTNSRLYWLVDCGLSSHEFDVCRDNVLCAFVHVLSMRVGRGERQWCLHGSFSIFTPDWCFAYFAVDLPNAQAKDISGSADITVIACSKRCLERAMRWPFSFLLHLVFLICTSKSLPVVKHPSSTTADLCECLDLVTARDALIAGHPSC